MTRDPDWRDYGACKGQTVIFFSEDKANIAVAKAICAACPVLLQCRQHGLKHTSLAGVWGGMTERERQSRVRKTRRRARARESKVS